MKCKKCGKTRILNRDGYCHDCYYKKERDISKKIKILRNERNNEE